MCLGCTARFCQKVSNCCLEPARCWQMLAVTRRLADAARRLSDAVRKLPDAARRLPDVARCARRWPEMLKG